MKPSFLSLPRPFVTALVMEKSLSDTIARVTSAGYAGAQAVGVHMRLLPHEEKSVEKLRELIDSTNRPILAMHYRGEPAANLTDEDRAGYLLNAAGAGASIVDVMGDFYDPSPMEITRNPDAIDRQKQLIDSLHELGCAVVMSSHLQVSRTADEVLEHLASFEERGADVVKIVPHVNTEEEMLESVRTVMLLRRELKKPFIYVANGRYGRHQRVIAPMFGAMLSFGAFPDNPSGIRTPHLPVSILADIEQAVYRNIDADI